MYVYITFFIEGYAQFARHSINVLVHANPVFTAFLNSKILYTGKVRYQYYIIHTSKV